MQLVTDAVSFLNLKYFQALFLFLMKTVGCPSNALFGDFCNLSPCQCGTSNGLTCQSGICSYFYKVLIKTL